jgi:hypothetical protein
MLFLKGSELFVNVSGLGGHCENQLRIVKAQALIETHKGNVIAEVHQAALLDKSKSCRVFKWNIMVQKSMTSLFDYQAVCNGSSWIAFHSGLILSVDQ